MNEFKIKDDFIELFKLLKASGLCSSGGEAKTLISSGQVKVDGGVETQKAKKIKKGHVVELNGEKLTVT